MATITIQPRRYVNTVILKNKKEHEELCGFLRQKAHFYLSEETGNVESYIFIIGEEECALSACDWTMIYLEMLDIMEEHMVDFAIEIQDEIQKEKIS